MLLFGELQKLENELGNFVGILQKTELLWPRCHGGLEHLKLGGMFVRNRSTAKPVLMHNLTANVIGYRLGE